MWAARWILLLGAILAACAARTDSEATAAVFEDPRFSLGDDPRWSSPEWNDEDWERRPLSDPPGETGLLWLRVDVTLEEIQVLGLDVSAAAAREVYWDGELIGKAGRVGNDSASEVTGPLDAVFPVPDRLNTPGRHLLAVRFSGFRRPAGASGLLLGVDAGDLRDLSLNPLRNVGAPLVFLGGFALVALYYGVLFAVDRRRVAVLFTSLLCLSVAALFVAEAWRPVFGYDYDWHGVRLRTVEALTYAVGLLLAATFVRQFAVARGGWLLLFEALVSGVVLVLVSDHETATLAVFTLSLAVALGLTARATGQRRPGAGLALAGVCVCFATLLVTRYDFMERGFFPAFAVLVAGILTSLGLQTREERRRYEATRAAAARLEAELLKKHLQPHFLMNTLTSVMEWVETDPPRGARALEALATELRTLSEVSAERTIPMERELALCRAHLDVMGYRRAVAFELDARGVDRDRPVPPAVLHTLLENAVTHNAYRGEVTFTLREALDGGRRQLVLRTPLAGAANERTPEGGGLRYVRARLEESFPGRWSLSSHVEEGNWVTRVELPGEEA